MRDSSWDWRNKWTLIGSDVVSLFPSLTAENTAKAVRSQALKSGIIWENIDSKWLRLYIHLNRNLSSDISQIEHLLPKKRKGKRGPEPGMSSKECLQRHLLDVYEKGELSSWTWPTNEPTVNEIRILMSIMLEISVRFFFANFVYTFGNLTFLQANGGPIGARLTMCIARLVMQDWWDKFSQILDDSKIAVLLKAIYVDDGRLIVEILKKGVIFNNTTGKFMMSPDPIDYIEGDIMDDVKRTEIEIGKAMNYINTDLRFTTETERDFEKGRLPTLSFETWSTIEGIRHSYFEKTMRSQILTQKFSSQSEQSKYSILVNELHRHLEVLDPKIENSEKVEIIDHFIQQLYNSDYDLNQISDIVESSLKGFLRKVERKKGNTSRYRKGEDTLVERERKKLLESTSWYRDKINDITDEAVDRDKLKMKCKTGSWRNFRKRNKWTKKEINLKSNIVGQPEKQKEKYVSVIFAPHTEFSSLAKIWRTTLEAFEKVSNIKLKVVERIGNKLIDILHKSNAWQDNYCNRLDCLICISTGNDEKKGLCKKRNVTYETFCITCHKKEKYELEKKKLEKLTNENRRILGGKVCGDNSTITTLNGQCHNLSVTTGENKRKITQTLERKPEKKKEKVSYNVKYIEETSRSSYERGLEHSSDYKRLEERSHLLRHYFNYHKDEIKFEELEFGMKVRKSFRTALERQIGEAVAIGREQRSGKTLLNSKGEFNRCVIHKIDTRSVKEKNKEKEKLDIEENSYKRMLRETKVPKRNRSRENRERTKDMKAACIEIQNENLSKWKKRRKLELIEREKTDKLDEENLKRMKRKNLCNYKKNITLKTLKDTGLLERKGLTKDMIEEKTALWRKYREENLSPEENTFSGIIEKEKTIVEIGKEVEVRLKKVVFKTKFSELSREDYMKTNCVEKNFSLSTVDQQWGTLVTSPIVKSTEERLSDVPKVYLSPENLSKVQKKILSEPKLNFVSASESSDLKDFSVVNSETLVKYDLLE